LPGADRMYPDTDSAPIPLKDSRIIELGKNIPLTTIDAIKQMKKWKIPEDTYTYILKKNLFPLLKRIVNELDQKPVFIATLLGHRLKFVEGHYETSADFDYNRIFDLVKNIIDKKLELDIIRYILPILYQHPKMDFDSLLTSMKFKQSKIDEITSNIPFLVKKFNSIRISPEKHAQNKWLMGQLRGNALGNISLKQLKQIVDKA
jgi:glutamyl-tRNA(Gln) amidotransferase subunit E